MGPPERPHLGRLDRLRVRHLRLLEGIAVNGSLSAAAEALGVSQPGATKMLQDMESAFGRPLLDRQARGGRLNPAGKYALARLRMALGALDALARGFGESVALPLVRLGMPPLVAIDGLPALAELLVARSALPRLAISEGAVDTLLQMLSDGELDCVVAPIRTGMLHGRTVRSARLWETRLAIACSRLHPLAGQAEVSAHLLTTERWALPPPRTSSRAQMDQWFLDEGVSIPVPHVESTSFHTNLTLAAANVCLAVAPINAIRHYEAFGMVSELRVARPLPEGNLFFVTPDGPYADGVEDILNGLLDVAAQRLGS